MRWVEYKIKLNPEKVLIIVSSCYPVLTNSNVKCYHKSSSIQRP